MFIWLLAGIGLLVALYAAGRLFASANPATLARGLRILLIALAILFGLFVLVRGLPAAAALLGGVAALAWRYGGLLRLLSLFGMWRAASRAAGPAAAAASASGPSASAVETAWLAMELDHATGEIDGTVRRGPSAGRRLSDLGVEELYALWLAVRAGDPRSLRLLETFLDRTAEDWRVRFEERAGRAASASSAAMTREEALSILGLSDGAGPDAIKDAHRDLMKKYHPDHGGSDYFAAKLNQAKAVLLGE